MCPLRIILIFISATLAGFFVLRNLKSHPADSDDISAAADSDSPAKPDSIPLRSQVYGVISKGFWTCVDMASGRYLWRHLVSSSNLKRND